MHDERTHAGAAPGLALTRALLLVRKLLLLLLRWLLRLARLRGRR
jgi:hypothetical protein